MLISNAAGVAMRDYGKVHTSFWASANIRNLSEDGRALALYLLTCPHGTIAGVFRLPDGYASEDLQWTSKRVREGFAELFANGFANVSIPLNSGHQFELLAQKTRLKSTACERGCQAWRESRERIVTCWVVRGEWWR